MAQATDLKKGDYFKHNNEILRVIKKELVAYGTHSHSKLKLYVQALDKKGEKLAKEIVKLSNGRLYIMKDVENLDKIILEDYYSLG